MIFYAKTLEQELLERKQQLAEDEQRLSKLTLLVQHDREEIAQLEKTLRATPKHSWCEGCE